MTPLNEQPYQVMPPLDDEQWHALRQSIKANGVLEPVVFDEDGEILDGHHRVAIAEELDIDYPRRVLPGLDHAGKLRYAMTTNAVRRQLAPAQVSSMIAHLRIKGMSIRQIAEATGASVGKVHKELKVFTDEHLPQAVTGTDGKQHPATRPAKTPGPSDTTTKPPVGPGTTPVPAVRESPVLTAPQEPDPTLEPVDDPTAPSAGSGQGDGGGPDPTTDMPDIDVLLTALERLLETVLAEVEAITAEVDLGGHARMAVELAANLQIAVDLLASCRAGVPA